MSAMGGCPLDIDHLLRTFRYGVSEINIKRKQTIFREGDPADAVFYIREGTVRLASVSAEGRQATIAVLTTGDLFGESALVEPRARELHASTMTDCRLLRIHRDVMVELLRQERGFSEWFWSYLLTRELRLLQELSSHLFNPAEKRLAWTLLRLSKLQRELPEVRLPKISHELLAQMVGTTRSRITVFMKKFRNNGLIDYDGELKVRVERMQQYLGD